ncbi:MAG: hypothetical protein LBS94_02995 [Prevotellaceae bacterium]|nr:hypothetical protein [Prevotellaceae bacterium]
MDKAFYWYLAHQNELVPQYDGKYLVISNNQVHGAYDDVVDAVSVGDREYTRGKFIVQRCSPGKKDTTVRITPFRISKL